MAEGRRGSEKSSGRLESWKEKKILPATEILKHVRGGEGISTTEGRKVERTFTLWGGS